MIVNYMVESYPKEPWFNHGIFGRGGHFIVGISLFCYYMVTVAEAAVAPLSALISGLGLSDQSVGA